MKKLFALISAVFCLLPSCELLDNGSAEEGKEEIQGPGIVILETVEVNVSSAVLKVSFESDGAPGRVTPTFRCGCISLEDLGQMSSPAGADIMAALSEKGMEGRMEFTSAPYGTASFDGLKGGTQYVAAAMVSYGPMNYYSNTFEFRTQEGEDDGENEGPGEIIPTNWEIPPAIDMGLPSGKGWAAFDLGAGTIADYGSYFAWGEIAPKAVEKFVWSDYKWCNGGSMTALTKYCHDSNFGYDGYSDTLSVLDAQDDAATVLLNADWSIPSYEDFIELMDNCDYKKAEVNGTWGMVFTSRVNGNSIFFPAGGSVENGVLRGFGKSGFWWCKSFLNFEVINGGPYLAHLAYLPEDYDTVFSPNDAADRSDGINIRPVCSNPSAYPVNYKVESILFDKLSNEIHADEVFTLKVTINPANAALTPITWESSDQSVAAVEYGKVTGISEGTATITATAGGKTASCTVTVKPSKVSSTKEVDLGLSVKWAGWNIGADAPQEYGKYFAWGETTAWALGWSGVSQYRFYDQNSPSSSPKFTKYVTSASYATDPQYVDGLSVLLPGDDAATTAWGGKWRMPTDAEKTELLANTTHEKYEYKGVKGYLFTSKKNGNAIFLPCTGIKIQGNNPIEDEYLCGFWTSTLKSDNSMAYIACNKTDSGLMPEAGFEMDPEAESWHLGQYRWYGLPVRAVLGN